MPKQNKVITSPRDRYSVLELIKQRFQQVYHRPAPTNPSTPVYTGGGTTNPGGGSTGGSTTDPGTGGGTTTPPAGNKYVASQPSVLGAAFGAPTNIVFNETVAAGGVVPWINSKYPGVNAVAYPYAAPPSNNWKDTSGNGKYDPNTMSMHDGVLDMHGYYDASIGKARVANLAPFGWDDDQLYGAFEIEYFTTVEHALKFIFMIWLNNWRWEVDAGEANLGDPWQLFVHTAGSAPMSGANGQLSASSMVPTTEKLVCRMEWLPGSLKVYLQGLLVFSTTNTSYISSLAGHLLLQFETTLDAGVVPTASTDGHVYILRVTRWLKA